MALRRISFPILFFFVLLASHGNLPATATESEKVSLGLYYESLCPYSANFIVKYLSKVFNNGLLDIINLNLVPYGNARITSNKTITCQHGPYECLLNAVEGCAISAWPDVQKHFAFIYCVESLVLEHKYIEWGLCFEKVGLDSQTIADCMYNGDGEKLQLQYAEETNALVPPHTYVPWVIVNGEPLYEDYENFVTYICKAYKGDIPAACSALPSDLLSKKLQPAPVCPAEEAKTVPEITASSHMEGKASA